MEPRTNYEPGVDVFNYFLTTEKREEAAKVREPTREEVRGSTEAEETKHPGVTVRPGDRKGRIYQVAKNLKTEGYPEPPETKRDQTL
jgi:hypothetical protein